MPASPRPPRRQGAEASKRSPRTNVPFQLLVESIKDYAIFMLDPAGHIVSWNAGAQRIKGYRADEILGRHFSCFYPSESQRSGWPDYELRAAASEARFEDEGWRVRKDGSRFWASVVITALYDDNGVLVGYAKVTRDLTQSKRIEALEESERRMSEFLAMLSHELRNPLAPIRTMVDLFKAKHLDDPQLDMIRDVIDKQVAHLTRVVSDLLDVARIQHGLIAVRRGPIDLSEVVAHSLQAVRPLITAKGHELHVSGADREIMVDGDLVRLSQVLVNLLNNAATYTAPGGEIWLGIARDGADAVITVRDTGRGIDPASLPEIFTFFGRLRRQTEDGGEGLGIGLGLVKRLVDLHDGQVEARSAGIGRGSEFTVRLPLLPELGSVEPPTETTEERPVESRRVLVVDDNKDFAESLVMLLESMGHEARMAHRGEQALALADEFRPDVVFLDIGLPDLDGYEVARRLRARPHAPCVLAALTGWGQESDKQAAAEAGFDHHLVKPVEMDSLESVLRASRQ
jgi:PAS domain S-box-containing protein